MDYVNNSQPEIPIREMAETTEVPIRDETIRLGQLLKLAGVVDDGAHARSLIEDGEVRVDGEIERRRGRQVRPGATVELGQTRIRVTST